MTLITTVNASSFGTTCPAHPFAPLPSSGVCPACAAAPDVERELAKAQKRTTRTRPTTLPVGAMPAKLAAMRKEAVGGKCVACGTQCPEKFMGRQGPAAEWIGAWCHRCPHGLPCPSGSGKPHTCANCASSTELTLAIVGKQPSDAEAKRARTFELIREAKAKQQAPQEARMPKGVVTKIEIKRGAAHGRADRRAKRLHTGRDQLSHRERREGRGSARARQKRTPPSKPGRKPREVAVRRKPKATPATSSSSSASLARELLEAAGLRVTLEREVPTGLMLIVEAA